jgi:hypothetical protein
LFRATGLPEPIEDISKVAARTQGIGDLLEELTTVGRLRVIPI